MSAVQTAQLAQTLAVPLTIARMLVRRGIVEEEQARCFLGLKEEPFHDPFLLTGMQEAVSLIEKRIKDEDLIAVYGDYDVDGASATSLLVRFLEKRGAHVTHYIPERQSEGYGLNVAALQKLIGQGVRLVITVDCGISAVQEVAAVADSLDIIITDHHQPPEQLPAAAAVINPKLASSVYPFQQLAGVGVALKVCQALATRFTIDETEWHALWELAMLGTIADIVPLTGENRLIVRKGLAVINAGGVVKGLQALRRVSGNMDRTVDTGVVGFGLAPRLNAAGRLSNAESAVSLLLTEEHSIAQQLAAMLDQENSERQQIEKEILQEAEAMIQAQGGAKKVLVLTAEGWHPGVIGIVASRLVERYYVPVVMISLSGSTGKGSCRSIEAFDLYQALTACSAHLLQFGGHHQAAGLTIDRDSIDAFRQAMEAETDRQLTKDDYRQPLRLDDSLQLGDVTDDLMQWLVKLEPFGMGNPRPSFAFYNVTIRDVQSMGADKNHLRLQLTDPSGGHRAVMWRAGHYLPALRPGLTIQVAAVAEYNYWRDQASIQLRILDIRQDVWIFDYRDAANKEGLLKNILQIDKKTVVYDKNDFQNANGHTRILSYYQPVPQDCELLVLAGLPPYSQEQPAWLDNLTKAGCNLALLFNREDEQQWLQQEETKVLNREKLAGLYRCMHKLGAAEGKTIAQAAPTLDEAGIIDGLAIFEELGLAKHQETGQWTLLAPQNGEKKAIEQSALFRHLRDEAIERRKHMASLFQRPADLWMSKLEDE